MHSYLRAIGFSKIKKKNDIDKIIKMIIKDPTYKMSAENFDGDEIYELRKEFGDKLGISIRGEYNDNNEFEPYYYYPYFDGHCITTEEIVEIEKHSEKESYAGVCDDVKVGVSIIFYLQNIIDYFEIKAKHNSSRLNVKTTISALSISGKVLLPIIKNPVQIENTRKSTLNRNHLISAARQGDEEAIESLTLEDIDTYTMISKKILHEDVYSLVDTMFMPYGIESDQYLVIGEIMDVKLVENRLTGEEIYEMHLICSDLEFDICINKEDLLGEPAIGRRFKGVVWIQGKINLND